MRYERPQIHILNSLLDETPQFMIVVAGPRQIGKSTMVRQAIEGRSSTFVATDQPVPDTFDFTEPSTSSFSFEPATPPSGLWNSGPKPEPKH